MREGRTCVLKDWKSMWSSGIAAEYKKAPNARATAAIPMYFQFGPSRQY